MLRDGVLSYINTTNISLTESVYISEYIGTCEEVLTHTYEYILI